MYSVSENSKAVITLMFQKLKYAVCKFKFLALLVN